MSHVKRNIEIIRGLPLKEETKEEILGGNAARILGAGRLRTPHLAGHKLHKETRNGTQKSQDCAYHYLVRRTWLPWWLWGTGAH